MKLILATAILSITAKAFPTARDRIPNGRAVPHPTIPNAIWAGVGHFAVGGGGPRNPFGLDFAAAGFQWTPELCSMDSDGDGRSNGQELGDPDCVWVAGDTPEMSAESHPGIVDEPATDVSTDTCKNYDPPNDTFELEITFSSPNVLSGDPTEYICEQFEVAAPTPSASAEQWFHQIKTEPMVDNNNVLHHMWIYQCDGTNASDGANVGSGPYSCSGIEANCQIVAGWALGGGAFCEPNNVGALINLGGSATVFKVEAHYDNAMQEATSDQSGMKLFLTRQLRPLNSGQVVLGMDYYDRQFQLPPGQSNAVLQNICPSEATQRLTHPVFVYTWNPHMHLYGKSLVTEHYRCGVKIGEIGNIQAYEFDNQQSYRLPTPVKILPGDALVTTCVYDTTDAAQTITGGEETSDEMCNNYLTYFPSAYNLWEPNLFTACSSFDQGLNPQFVGYNDFTPFATMDLGGDSYVENYEKYPIDNLAPCCSNGGPERCEEVHRSHVNQPCAVDEDCRGSLVCWDGLCALNNWFD